MLIPDLYHYHYHYEPYKSLRRGLCSKHLFPFPNTSRPRLVQLIHSASTFNPFAFLHCHTRSLYSFKATSLKYFSGKPPALFKHSATSKEHLSLPSWLMVTLSTCSKRIF